MSVISLPVMNGASVARQSAGERMSDANDRVQWCVNKAGYTANTSRGRVGRGGNARFHTFKLDHHGPTDRRTDKASYRVACPRLKTRLSRVKTDPELGHDALQLGVVLWPHVMHYGYA